MEIWDILDKNGNPTGKTVERKKVCLQKGEYHLVVHIWVLGSDGRVLIQRRSLQKPLMPGEWAAIGGSAVSGEAPKDAAKRELFEEMGIETDELSLIGKTVRRSSILYLYLALCDLPVSELKLQEEEVSEAKWVHRNKLRQMIKNGQFHNYGSDYFSTVFGEFDRRSLLKRRKRKHEHRRKKQ